MIAGDQVAVLVIQPGQAFDLPARLAQQVDPGVVVADPGFVDMAHQFVGDPLRRRERQAQLEQADDEQRGAADNGVEPQQQRGNHPAQWRG
ncbi:hypothetical protein D3C75_1151620 [compost metagenome]